MSSGKETSASKIAVAKIIKRSNSTVFTGFPVLGVKIAFITACLIVTVN